MFFEIPILVYRHPHGALQNTAWELRYGVDGNGLEVPVDRSEVRHRRLVCHCCPAVAAPPAPSQFFRPDPCNLWWRVEVVVTPSRGQAQASKGAVHPRLRWRRISTTSSRKSGHNESICTLVCP